MTRSLWAAQIDVYVGLEVGEDLGGVKGEELV